MVRVSGPRRAVKYIGEVALEIYNASRFTYQPLILLQVFWLNEPFRTSGPTGWAPERSSLRGFRLGRAAEIGSQFYF